jgi:hypothetical protein
MNCIALPFVVRLREPSIHPERVAMNRLLHLDGL